ncbi:hypothetical protein KY313_01610 [Candidatus Woesearchaeota archaeon]|jgi:hypothetical protein|nr:hypothetical protein [Candidatus Woesearchaeota archaeon]
MKIILTTITIILQIIIGHLLAFFGTFAAGIGNGWELIVWPFWNILGVWGVGAIIAKWGKTFNKKQYISTLIGTIIGSTIGTVMMANSLGLFVFNPLIGALIGFYVPLRNKKKSKK